MKKEKGYRTLTFKINRIIFISLIIGIGSITFLSTMLYYWTVEQSIKKNLHQQTRILYTSIENAMLQGEAPRAVEYFNDIQQITDAPPSANEIINNENAVKDYTIRLYRSDGNIAFQDDATIMIVNERLGMNRFMANREADFTRESPEPMESQFNQAVNLPFRDTEFTVTEGNHTFFHIYKPLINLPKCSGCHGTDHMVRGVIDIQANISAEVFNRNAIIIITSGLFFIMVILIAIILARFMRRRVIKPVNAIGEVCSKVTVGDFSQRAAVRNKDEIGVLGTTVNTMVEGLRERYELSKYVSSSTIDSLKADSKGATTHLTLLFSDIRGFTSYTEKTDPDLVVENLNKVLNIQTEIITSYGGDIDKYVGDEIVALFRNEDAARMACKAAVDIQKELEKDDLYHSLKVGIGINSGDVIMGMIGSERRADFTVIGDNVNTAARLCDAAKPGQVVVSDSIFENIKNDIKVDGPYKMKAKGKEQYLKVHIIEEWTGGEVQKVEDRRGEKTEAAAIDDSVKQDEPAKTDEPAGTEDNGENTKEGAEK